jgi:hypothetical protein
MLANLHWDCLQALLGDDVAKHVLPKARSKLFGAMRGEIDGATRAAGVALIERVEREGVQRIFLNGSNLGQLARMVKRAHPRVEVLTFFHNVETRFFLGALRQHPGPRAFAVLAANHVAERKATRFSDPRSTNANEQAIGSTA